jgi:hypothetical protein
MQVLTVSVIVLILLVIIATQHSAAQCTKANEQSRQQ